MGWGFGMYIPDGIVRNLDLLVDSTFLCLLLVLNRRLHS